MTAQRRTARQSIDGSCRNLMVMGLNLAIAQRERNLSTNLGREMSNRYIDECIYRERDG